MEVRDFKEPRYKRWRIAVFKRDKFTCRMCGNNRLIEAHHIRRWADYPQLRYVVPNGITLCKVCHTLIRDREDEFAPRFILMIGNKCKKDIDTFIRIKMAMRRKCNTQ